MSAKRLKGIIVAAATPLRPDGTIDLEKLVAHCRRLLDLGCDGINLLGTTGEATSFPVQQREEAMQAVSRSSLPLDRFMVGTGAAALADAARLTATARDLGFAGALLLPPFYYKNIPADGVTAYVEALIATVGAKDLRLYLYHYPQLSGVPYSPETVEQLYRAHPEQLLGLKDSSGDMAYAAGVAERCPGFDVFPSTEGAFGSPSASLFAGCISASVNVTAPLVARSRRETDAKKRADALARAVAVRTALAGVPLIPAVKWALGDLLEDESWLRLAPPLRPLSAGDLATLKAALRETAYAELTADFRERAQAG